MEAICIIVIIFALGTGALFFAMSRKSYGEAQLAVGDLIMKRNAEIEKRQREGNIMPVAPRLRIDFHGFEPPPLFRNL